MRTGPIKLEVGNIVRLQSGGPNMTVVAVGSWGLVTCQWFDGNKLYTEKFVYDTLRKIFL